MKNQSDANVDGEKILSDDEKKNREAALREREAALRDEAALREREAALRKIYTPPTKQTFYRDRNLCNVTYISHNSSTATNKSLFNKNLKKSEDIVPDASNNSVNRKA